MKYYQVPHRYRLRRHNCGVAICQYQLFSPQNGIDRWLPLEVPSSKPQTPNDVLRNQTGSIPLTRLVSVNCVDTLGKEIGFVGSLAQASSGQLLLKQTFDRTLKDLLQLELDALSMQCSNMEQQRVGEDEVEADAITAAGTYKTLLQKEMHKNSSTIYGYITWLDYSRSEDTDNEWLRTRRPLITPILDGISVVDGDDDGTGEIPNANATAGKKVEENARSIVAAVSRKVIYQVDSQKSLMKISAEQRTISAITNDFKVKLISQAEYDWFSVEEREWM